MISGSKGHGAGTKAQGFTIVEIMVVLVVSTAIFLSAVLLITGRQNKTQFDQTIRQVQSKIQQTINEVATGYYPNNNDIQCIAAPFGLIISSAANEQGTNKGCVFLGKAIQFGVHDTDPEQYITYSIAGVQRTIGGDETSSLSEAKPVAIAPATSAPYSSNPDKKVVSKLENGMTVLKPSVTTPHGMYYDNGAGPVEIGTVAFISSQAKYSGGTIVSGSQQVHLVPIGNTAQNTTSPTTAEAINTNLPVPIVSPIDPSNGVNICFVSGTTSQSGLITIGSSGRQLSVTLAIKNNLTCA